MRGASAAALVVVAVLAACGSGGDDSDTTTTAAGAPTSAAAPVGPSDPDLPPIPDQATADAYIAALDAIDPGIDRNDPSTAIARGRNQCTSIRDNPGDRAAQVEAVNQRFTSTDHPTGWGPDVAGQILDVVHQHLCPAF